MTTQIASAKPHSALKGILLVLGCLVVAAALVAGAVFWFAQQSGSVIGFNSKVALTTRPVFNPTASPVHGWWKGYDGQNAPGQILYGDPRANKPVILFQKSNPSCTFVAQDSFLPPYQEHMDEGFISYNLIYTVAGDYSVIPKQSTTVEVKANNGKSIEFAAAKYSFYDQNLKKQVTKWTAVRGFGKLFDDGQHLTGKSAQGAYGYSNNLGLPSLVITYQCAGASNTATPPAISDTTWKNLLAAVTVKLK